MYKCNVVKVCSGLMTDVIKSFCATLTDSHHAVTANLLRGIIMVRDNSLTLPGWFTRDDINDIIFSRLYVSRKQCVTCALCAFCCFFSVCICIVCYVSLSIVYFGYDFNIKEISRSIS